MKSFNALAICALTISSPLQILATPTAPSDTPQCPPPALWRKLQNTVTSYIWARSGSKESEAVSCYKTSVSAITADTREFKKSAALNARYGRDTVLRFNVSSAEDVQAIAEAAEDLYLDIWEFSDNWVDIRLARDIVPSLLGLLPESLQTAHAPLIPDTALVELISRTLPSSAIPPFSPSLRTTSKDLFFTDYQPLSVIEPWMRLLQSLFSSHARLISIGKSYEGRDIFALRVGVHPTNKILAKKPRKTIVMTGGLHAREWVSVSSVNYVAHQLITSYGKNHLITKLLESFDLVFVPTLNPDGYIYTWETDRLWRKNRQPTSLRFCNGIDIDRSFSFEWDGTAKPANPCSESYAGEEPWAAHEAQVFGAWAKNETQSGQSEFVALLDLHSYSQQVLYPYSFSCESQPPTLETLEEVAMGLAKAMHSGGKQSYQARSACEGNVYVRGDKKGQRIGPRMELGGGSLLDWFYHELKIPYAYQVKLRDTGSYGFLLPKENIIPQGRELMGAVEYLGKYLMGEIGITGFEEPAVALRKMNESPDDDDVAAVQFELRRKRR